MTDLEASGILNQGQANAFEAKLDAALAAVEEGNPIDAMDSLTAFVDQVDAYVNAGILQDEEAQSLTNAAVVLRQELNGEAR